MSTSPGDHPFVPLTDEERAELDAFEASLPRPPWHVYYDPDGQPISFTDWLELFNNRHGDDPAETWWRHRTSIEGLDISTVWMGMDHNWTGEGPPIIWETMIFRDGEGDETRRYATRAEAFDDHERIVREFRLLQAATTEDDDAPAR